LNTNQNPSPSGAIISPLNTLVYEFKISKGGQWQSRRISIGRIGEDSGARSKCFYVIFDNHFVIKIPPEPITDFNEYIQSIKADRQIADILAPRECLVPKLSIVLKKIPAFAKFMYQSTDDDEKICMNGLKSAPEFQDFLKIAGSFAYFMDLSKYFFLGEILKECHDTKGLIEKEFKKHQDLVWIPASFTDRYGEESTNLCFELQNLFNLFDNQLNNKSFQMFEKKTWFKKLFIDNDSATVDKNQPFEVTTVIEKIRNQHSGTINSFKKILQKKAHEQSFKQNIARIQSICSRMTELLAWLFFKNVAIRDLKPDNILVAGDPSKYPQFLSSSNDFELGLIDVEIAVFVGENISTIQQPKLGWTPFYATPTHMFFNDVLKKLYDDIGYILKLQDWYAIVAMIYEAITGEKLFVRTAALIATLGKEMPLYFSDSGKMTAFAKKASVKFWNTANEELELRLKENETALKIVYLDIFQNTKKMFMTAVSKSDHKIIGSRLSSIKSQITAYELIHCMFSLIRHQMHNENWNTLVTPSQPLNSGNVRPDDKTMVL
jgi:serine/threonine protein kinase